VTARDQVLHAAAGLSLGRNEKLFLEIVESNPLAPETHVIGDPRTPRTETYYIRPFGHPAIEGFFGGEGAQVLAQDRAAAAFAYAIDQLAALFGSDVRRSLRPLAASVSLPVRLRKSDIICQNYSLCSISPYVTNPSRENAEGQASGHGRMRSKVRNFAPRPRSSRSRYAWKVAQSWSQA
jgi:hypothetical protein